MHKFGKAALPVLAVVMLLVIGNPSSLWASFIPTPEIDASSGMSALALIAGAVLLIRGRRKK
jgi:hypothetical protein